MFKMVEAKSIEEYFAALPPERKQALEFLQKTILDTAPSLKPIYLYNMPGYGSFKYKNYRKEIIDWPVISVASQKNYISVYVCALEGEGYLAEKHKGELGKVSVGKSCIRFKKIEDLNIEAFKKIIIAAEKSPGFGNT